MENETINLPRPDELLGCTCLQVRKLARIVTQIYDRALEPVGLTCTQFSMLSVLLHRSGLSVGELADFLVMDATTVTRGLQPLERRGLLALRTSRKDRRRRALGVTEEGRAVFRAAVPKWRQARRELERLVGADQVEALGTAMGASTAALTAR